MSAVDPSDEDAVRAALEGQWLGSATDGAGRVYAQFCPLCGAQVPFGTREDPADATAVRLHERHHLQVARLLAESRRG